MRTLVIVLLLFAGAPAVADSAGGEATARGRLEAAVGASYSVDSTARFADETPRLSLGLALGYYLTDDLRLDLGGASDVAEPDADAYEGFARVTLHRRVPLGRFFAGLRGGYYWTESRGSDYVASERGPRAAADLGFRLVPPGQPASFRLEPTLSLSVLASHSNLHRRNASSPRWTRGVTLNLGVPVSF